MASLWEHLFWFGYRWYLFFFRDIYHISNPYLHYFWLLSFFFNLNKLEKRKNKSEFNLNQTWNGVQILNKFTLIKSLIKLREQKWKYG